MYRRKSLAERFWAKVAKGLEPSECWRWTGSKRTGYGMIGEGGTSTRTIPAHRVSWELAHGPIPPGMVACHRCDNRECVNPAHLFLGTQADNIADMHRKGRACTGDAMRAALLASPKFKSRKVRRPPKDRSTGRWVRTV